MPTLQKMVRIHGENIGRSLRKKYAAASLPSWDETGEMFHRRMRPNRFTDVHAKEAKYLKRKERYTKQKFNKFGHRRPLEWSGGLKAETSSAQIKPRGGTGQIANQITGSANNQGGVQVIYRARVFNLRNKNTKINMPDEFRRITKREATTLGAFFQVRFENRFYS